MSVIVRTKEQLESAIRRGVGEIAIEGDLAPQFKMALEIADGKKAVPVGANELLPTTDKDWTEIVSILNALVPHVEDWMQGYALSNFGEDGPVVLKSK